MIAWWPVKKLATTIIDLALGKPEELTYVTAPRPREHRED
jgi:hypothetical protein